MVVVRPGEFAPRQKHNEWPLREIRSTGPPGRNRGLGGNLNPGRIFTV